MSTNVFDIRAALAASRDRVAAVRARLGVAVADGADPAPIHTEIAAIEAEVAGLEAAIPVAEQRAADAQAAAAQVLAAENVRLKAQVRERRRRAAARVDDALRRVGRSFAAYLAAEGTGLRQARQRGFYMRAALHRWAPEFATAIECERVAAAHRRGLEEHEEVQP